MVLADLPTPAFHLDPDPKRRESKTRQLLVEEGRVARRGGMPKDWVNSRFKDPDMASDWQNGWRWEDEEIKARRSKARR